MMKYLLIFVFLLSTNIQSKLGSFDFSKLDQYDWVIDMGQSSSQISEKVKWKCTYEYFYKGECKIAIGQKACWKDDGKTYRRKDGFYRICKERRNHKNVKIFYYKLKEGNL